MAMSVYLVDFYNLITVYLVSVVVMQTLVNQRAARLRHHILADSPYCPDLC